MSTQALPSVNIAELSSSLDNAGERAKEYGQKEQEALSHLGDFHTELEELRSSAPKLEAPTPFKGPNARDPVEAFGSVAGALGMIASLLTRTPLKTALNAAAAGINAIKAQDEVTYKKSFDEWKANTDYALKVGEFQQQRYSSILSTVTTDINTTMANARAFASAIQDQPMLAMIEAGSPDKVLELQASRANLQASLAQSSTALEDLNAKRNLYQEGLKALGPNATAPQKIDLYNSIHSPSYAYHTSDSGTSKTLAGTRAKLINDGIDELRQKLGKEPTIEQKTAIMQDITRSGATGNQIDKYKTRVDEFDQSLSKIDESIAVLDKYVGAAGVAGRARRLAESASNIFGSNYTDLTQFRRNIEYIQVMAHRLLTDAQGRPLSTDAKRIDDVVGGLAMGDTTANTTRALNELKEIYARSRAQTMGLIGNNWEAGGAPNNSSQGGARDNSAAPNSGGNAPPPWETDPIIQ